MSAAVFGTGISGSEDRPLLIGVLFAAVGLVGIYALVYSVTSLVPPPSCPSLTLHRQRRVPSR
ncbi:hypothetical protein [Rhodococcus aetherivorans]|uniref:hypothetical protein n=1 Tax=Rhodococcus aetherivorans TaxID=191292 RepID=UPI001E4A2BE0|nr:hypothetical protein [Rhodococcus aetherivorans]UGQ42732.1 hypothetical protein LRQ66_05290 [Rhodococcus aetherivorans]